MKTLIIFTITMFLIAATYKTTEYIYQHDPDSSRLDMIRLALFVLTWASTWITLFTITNDIINYIDR